MSYEVYITRAEDWVESDERPIELEEWVVYAEASPDLTRDGPFGVDEPGFFNLRVGQLETWLAWSNGKIYSKNPPAPVRAKMHEVARAFGANVQGDDGELYDGAGAAIPETLPVSQPTTRLGTVLAYLVGGPVIFAINSPLGALASLAAMGVAVWASFAFFDGIAAIAAAAAAVVALLALMALRVVSL